MRRQMQYITRQEAGTVNSWVVRIDQGKPTEISKTFADKNYGSKEKALQAAKVFRDSRLAERKLDQSPSQHLWQQSTSNKSGFIGIKLETKEYPHSIYTGWRVTYYEDGMQVHRSFSCKNYGECEAFRKACRLRYDKTGELRQVHESPDIPCAPDVPVIHCYVSNRQQKDEEGNEEGGSGDF